MDPDDIAHYYPRLYHMAEGGSWESIRRHGLLSTGALLDLFDVEEPMRTDILSLRRPTSVALDHPRYGGAVVRDQIPLSQKKLEACLTDMTFAEWLRTLNSRVFFWLTETNLHTLLGANAYKDSVHDVLVIDTAALLERHADRITLSPINSGSTLYKAVPRGSHTFLPIADYPFADRKRLRGTASAIVELAVDGGVPDIEDVAISVERRQHDQPSAVIWQRS